MALISTPAYIQAVNDAFKKYHETMWSGTGITKDNFTTDPATREQTARNQISQDLGNALDTWLENTIFTVEIGTLETAGSPASQTNVSPGLIQKT